MNEVILTVLLKSVTLRPIRWLRHIDGSLVTECPCLKGNQCEVTNSFKEMTASKLPAPWWVAVYINKFWAPAPALVRLWGLVFRRSFISAPLLSFLIRFQCSVKLPWQCITLSVWSSEQNTYASELVGWFAFLSFFKIQWGGTELKMKSFLIQEKRGSKHDDKICMQKTLVKKGEVDCVVSYTFSRDLHFSLGNESVCLPASLRLLSRPYHVGIGAGLKWTDFEWVVR